MKKKLLIVCSLIILLFIVFILLKTINFKDDNESVFELSKIQEISKDFVRDTNYIDFLKYKNISDLKQELQTKRLEVNEDSSKKFVQQLNLSEQILNDGELNKIINQNKLQLIHGDFTPDNIIFDNNEVKSIIDFELNRVGSERFIRSLSSHTSVHTLAYGCFF